ncbi:proton-coupled amino acid transporter-like protein CG1139 isoform X3 [Pararge aegeria]|uniref:proton-coupled amino acid transporter-like protein CG1139 isoform X3 n=1 Tax=Pararge aegeria TaxID=116150 RepID=UPI0019D11397|nr:proton-coupled amino acid transporter-like protein CG1139 isoform X3 [Pararge aegeria]
MRLSNDSDDDISSMCNLEFELNQYLEKEGSTAYNVYPGVEMIDYDFTAERQNLYSTNVLESTAHLVKSCLGAGILGMHEAYMYGGLWTSLGLTVVVGFLVSYSMFVLASVTDYKLSMSILILIITAPLIALCLIRSLKYLAPFSLVADLIIVTCVLTTMYYSISVAADLNKRPVWKSTHGLLRFLGICIYSINGIGVTLPIENNMRRPVYFRAVLQWGMPFVVTLVMIIGFFGYWAWGEQCRSPFTVHMPSNTILTIMQGFLTITLGVTFAVHFWVPFRIIWHYVGRNYKKRRGVWERLYRTVYVFMISCLSIAFPNMSNWMSFLGNFFTAFLVFIFPAIMETMITWKEPRKLIFRLSLLKNVSLVLFGLFLGGGAFYSS